MNATPSALRLFRAATAALAEADILEPSEAFRKPMDYYSHTRDGRIHVERLTRLESATLACMHGSAWRGDGGKLLRGLADALER